MTANLRKLTEKNFITWLKSKSPTDVVGYKYDPYMLALTKVHKDILTHLRYVAKGEDYVERILAFCTMQDIRSLEAGGYVSTYWRPSLDNPYIAYYRVFLTRQGREVVLP